MSSPSDKTPSRDEQLRKLLAEAKEDQIAMEDMVMKSAEKSKRMSDALEGLLAENLEEKMVKAMDHSGEVRFELLDTFEDSSQVIHESSERSALRPSRRDTNSPQEDRSIQNRATQDVRGQTRPGHVQDHESAKIEELERKLRDFEEAE